MSSRSIILGTELAYGGARRTLSLPASTLLRHAFVIGQTGVGKTTLLLSVLAQLIEAGAGVGLLDPHGTAARALLDLIPPKRARDVVCFEPGRGTANVLGTSTRAAGIGRPIPGRPERPRSGRVVGAPGRVVGLNPLYGVPEIDHHLAASAVTESIRALHADSWGDRLDWILYNALRALLYLPGSTVLDVPRLLVDEAFRRGVVARVRDQAVVSFWVDEFAAYDRAFRTVAVAPVQNKVGKLRAHPPLRAVLGQAAPRVDLGLVLERSQIVVADLSGIGTGSANLLGSLLLSGLLTAAMRRDTSGEASARPFVLVADEAHRFTTESVTTLMSEARKYGLGLVLADQYLDQLTLPIRQAVFGNAATMVAFRVGASDTEPIARHLGASAPQLADLDPYQALVRTVAGSEAVGPLRLLTHPLRAKHYGRGEALRRASQERFGATLQSPCSPRQ